VQDYELRNPYFAQEVEDARTPLYEVQVFGSPYDILDNAEIR
jgi:hypothetical protein